MGKFITPQVFFVAETGVDYSAVAKALEVLGARDWPTDAEDDASYLTEFAGKSCYLSFDTALNKNLTRTGTRNNYDYIQNAIIGHRHGSVLEHSSVSVFITNVSRVVTHEIVRHRAGAAYSQTSGRYVRGDSVDMYLPSDIASDPQMVAVFQRAVKQMEENVRELEEISDVGSKPFSLKKKLTSAFRRIIGNGQANHILVTANHRAWRHMIASRTDPHAEEEIRFVFAEISKEMRKRYPAIYGDALIAIVDGIEVTTFENDKV